MTENSKPTVQFALRFDPALRDRIKLAAEANGRSMNQEIATALESAFPELIGKTAYMRANEERVLADGMWKIVDIDQLSSEILLRPNTGAGQTIDPKRMVRTKDGLLFMEVVCLP